MPWRDNMDYERIGLRTTGHHPRREHPGHLSARLAGKNVSVIIEVISMNHILKHRLRRRRGLHAPPQGGDKKQGLRGRS
jgi:serine kinase of HPr protein (carbohydrate metabolism regulator)